MRIQIQLKNDTVFLTDSASTFEELSRIIEGRVHLPEHWEIQYEINKKWNSLDKKAYLNLIEKGFDEIKIRIEEKNLEESCSDLTFSYRESEINEDEISQEKYLENSGQDLYKSLGKRNEVQHKNANPLFFVSSFDADVTNQTDFGEEKEGIRSNHYEMNHKPGEKADKKTHSITEAESLEKKFKEGLEKVELESVDELNEEFKQKSEELDASRTRKREKKVKELEPKVQHLQELLSLYKRIQELKSPSSNPPMNELEQLENQLMEGLEKEELESVDELNEELEKKSKELDASRARKRENKIKELEPEVQRLERLYSISERIKQLKISQGNSFEKDLELREKELKEGLEEEELEGAEELNEELEKKSEELDGYRAKNREKKVKELEPKVQRLQKLQSIVQDIQRIKQIHFQRPILEEIENQNQQLDQSGSILGSEASNIDDEMISQTKRLTELRNLKDDIYCYPDCVEKSLLKLKYFTMLRSSNSEDFVKHGFVLSEQADQEIEQELGTLKEKSRQEDVSIYDEIQKIEVNIHCKGWKEAEMEINKALKKIRSLDIQELFRLISYGENAATLIEGKDVILFLGGTGAGKSTTIHYLAGSEMQLTKVNGIDHIGPKKIRINHLEKVTTSSSSKSETRYITSVPVDLTQLGSDNKGQVILCDTPGFGDTAGPEVDIANALSIVEAIKKSNSVKPIILVSYKSIGDRFQGLKSLAYILVGMIPSLEDHINRISYLFTKYPEDQKSSIYSSIKLVHEGLNEEEMSDIGFYSLFRDMLRKTRHRACAVNPLNKKEAIEILDELIDSRAIERPKEVFKFSLNEISRSALQDQARRHQLNIMNALKRFDYDLIKFRLDELQKLLHQLGAECIRTVYADCTREIGRYLDDQYQAAIDAISRCLNEENGLNENDIEEFNSCIEHAKAADEIKKIHLEKSVIESSAYMQNLKVQLKSMLESMKKKKIDDTSFQKILDKMKLISQSFTEAEQYYATACEILEYSFLECKNSFKLCQASEKFEDCGNELTRLQKSLTLFNNHWDSEDKERTYEDLKKCFVEDIKKTTENHYSLLNQPELNDKDIKVLNEWISKLESIKNEQALRQHIPKEDLESIYKQLCQEIIVYYESINAKIQELFKEKKEKSFVHIEPLFKEMVLIRKVPVIKNFTSGSFEKTLSILCGFIEELKRDVILEIETMDNRTTDINCRKICDYIQGLESSKWIRQFRSEQFSSIMENVKDRIIEYCELSRDKIRSTPLDFKNPDNIKEVYQKVTVIEGMEAFEKLFSGLQVINDEIKQIFSDQIKDNALFIRDYLKGLQEHKLNHKPFNFIKFEGMIKYLRVCQKVITSNNLARDTLCEIENVLQSYRQYVSNEMNELFGRITDFKRHVVRSDSSPNSITNSIYDEDLQEDELSIKGDEKKFQLKISNLNEIPASPINKADLAKRNKEFLSTKANTLAFRLKEIKDIYEKCPHIVEFFGPSSNLFEEWKRRLEENHNEMDDDMNRYMAEDQIENLNDYILIAKALSKLDEFLINACKYSALFREFQNRFYQQAPEALAGVIHHIRLYEYENVSMFMSQLERASENNELCQQQLNKLKGILNNSLEDFMDQLESQTRLTFIGNNFNPEKIRPIIKDLKKINQAGDFVGDFLNAEVLDKLKNCEKNIRKTIESGLKRLLKSLNDSIAQYNFYEVNQQRQIVDIICGELGSFCTEDVLEEMRQLDQTEKDVLEDLEKKYENLEIKDFVVKPPKDIFAKFEKLTPEFSQQKYHKAQEAIKEHIVRKFRESIEKVRDQDSGDLPNTSIRKIESALNSLPADLKNILKDDIENYKEDINNSKQDLENSLKSLIKGNDLKRAAGFIQECKKTGSGSLIRQLEEYCLVQTSKLKSGIIEKIESKNIKDIFTELRLLNEYKNSLGSHCDFLESYWTETEDFIGGVIHEKFSLFIKNMKQELGFLGESKAAREDDSYLIDFNELLNTCHAQKVVFSQAFLESFGVKFIEMNDVLSDYFKELKEKYTDALKELNINALEILLKFLQIWSKHLPKIQTYAKRGSPIDGTKKSFEDLAEVLNQVESFDKVRRYVFDRVQTLKQELENEKLVPEKTKNMKSSRDEYYENLNKRVANLMKIPTPEWLYYKTSPLIEDLIKRLQGQLTSIYHQTENFVRQIFNQKETKEDDLKQLNINLNNILSLEEFFKVRPKVKFTYEKIEREFFNHFSKWERVIANNGSQPNDTHLTLIRMKMLAENLEAFNSKIDGRINGFLQSYKQKYRASGIARLGQLLNQDQSGHGQRILQDYNCFQGFSLSLFNTRTKAYGIEKVLANIRSDDGINKELLQSRYTEFDKIYKYLLKLYLKPKLDLSPLVSDIKILCGRIKQDSLAKSWHLEIAPKIPKLLAHIFLVWTLQNAEHYFEANELEDKDNYLLQPHAAQVISIFRLLGVGESKEVLQNNLVQIGTGEGKSVTLAVTASVFALFGFDVSCACYSSYLSERDLAAFKDLFETLNISTNIHYGNFNQLNEESLNKNGDIRQLVRDFISQEAAKSPSKDKASKDGRILLIDEVDVFFSKDFYGGLYTPSTDLTDPTIEALIDLIWKAKNSSTGLKKIKATQEYQDCCDRFKGWESLIEEAVKDMLFDLKAFGSHDYIVKDDKIGYVEHEQISFNISYRYQTLFAYYAEHEKGNISKTSLKKNKSIRIKCGHFSYAEIPKQFEFIMGVTGTLETLNKAEKDVIKKRYKIVKNTYIPSVFGQNNLEFIPKDDVFVENADDYHLKIRREIERKIFGRGKGKRAVLVFFESAKRLSECLESGVFHDLKDQIEVLTEEANSQERETRVRRATSSGHITFLTKTFGRGTDFVCQDETVEKNDGVHVIQTFVSEEFSEEVQIRGRTARQGKFGSYSMVLLESGLERFLIKKEDLEDVKNGKSLPAKVFSAKDDSLASKVLSALSSGEKRFNTIYHLIHERRNELFESQFGENEKFVDAAKAYHDKSLAFLQALHTSNINAIKDFLLVENEGASEAQKSRTVVLMDATGSMSQLLHKAKNSVGTMFERACKILKDHNIAEDSFGVQFAVYRNYSNDETQILQSSIWETKPDNLRSFMEKIGPSGGMGNEAIEIGLWHANNEHEKEVISQVILIGDAGANTNDEVTSKRSYKGETYWRSTKFATRTFWRDEAEKLDKNNIPIHAFYVHESAKESFTEISTLTKGKCEFLDVNASEGTDSLVNSVTETLLGNIGQQNGKGDSLVEAYRNVFIKSYN